MAEESKQADLGLWSEGEAPAPRRGRDELNIAEFPLTALSNRIANGAKTLEFKDRIFDKAANQLVERKLTVTAADKYGLPTALDDEVILALVQLSKKHEFNSKVVTFSRYEIIRILGWKDQTSSYRRIEESLDRWLGVTLKYENAWWNAEEKTWMTEGFHILDRLTTVKDDASGTKRNAFVWNDLIFKSFQDGNLKSLDLEAYRSLRSSVAKRLYRLLDKRFYMRRRQEFDLIELGSHKLGLSRNYSVGSLKAKLHPAVEELERMGFIKTVPKKQRYVKFGVGVWHVIFEKADAAEPALPVEIETVGDVEQRMLDLGVSPLKARRLKTTMPHDFLEQKLEVVEYLLSIKGKEPANPAGYLVKSIEEDYAPPKDFKTKEELKKEAAAAAAAKAKREAAKAAKEEQERLEKKEQERQEHEREQKVAEYLNSFPADKQEAIIQKAYEEAPAHLKKYINSEIAGGFAEMSRRVALTEYVYKQLGEESPYPKD